MNNGILGFPRAAYLRVTRAGYVGIGTNAPDQKLKIIGNEPSATVGVNTWIKNESPLSFTSLATLSDGNSSFNQFITFGSVFAGNRFTTLPAAGLNEFSSKGNLVIGTSSAHSLYLGTSGAVRATMHASGGFSLGNTVDHGASNLSVSGHIGSKPPVTITTDYTVLATDSSIISNRAATNTLTMPTASSYPGRWLYVRTIQAQTVVSDASNVVPRVGGAAGTAILAAVDGAWAALQSDGTAWEIMMSS